MKHKELLDKLISEMELPKKRYKNPFILTFCGYSGTGKTTFAKVLSHELEAYVVGGDHVRQILYKAPYNYDDDKNNQVTNEICNQEIEYLIKNKISVIVDKSLSSKAEKNKLLEKFPNLISVHLISNDEENIKRLKKKGQGIKFEYKEKAYGDINDESGVSKNPEEIYTLIKKRKLYDLEEFDFEINTLQPIEEVIQDVKRVAKVIKKTYK